jgi:hypothetical protein
VHGPLVDQGLEQSGPDEKLELHRLDRGDTGDGVKRNVGIVLLVNTDGVICGK